MAEKKNIAISSLTPRVLNVAGSAAYIGVSVSKFNNMRMSGTFPVKPLSYGKYYDIVQINAWLDSIGGLQGIEELHAKAWLEAASG